MNGYVCFYKGKRIEVYADSIFAAQQQGANLLRAKRTHEVAVVLAEKNGETVTHSTAEV
jgi:hypothetical protein